jgi:hypothetical protein
MRWTTQKNVNYAKFLFFTIMAKISSQIRQPARLTAKFAISKNLAEFFPAGTRFAVLACSL